MSSTTPNLGLFKYNTTADANVAFSITKALNNNWDKIDTEIAKKLNISDSPKVIKYTPNYSAKVEVSLTNNYTIGTDCWLNIIAYWANKDTRANLYINGTRIISQQSANDNGWSQADYTTWFGIVSATDVITFNNYSTGSFYCVKIPFKE